MTSPLFMALLPLLTQTLAEGPPEPLLTALIIPVIVIFVLVIANGVFVAAEFAMLGSRASRMEQLADTGNKTATKVLDVLEDTEKQNSYLATAQLGITVVTLGLSMYGEPKIAHFLEPYIKSFFELFGVTFSDSVFLIVEFIIAIGLLTYLHVVIGEMIPKSMALSQPNRTVLYLNPIMGILQRLLSVPIFILNGIGNGLLRLCRIPAAHGSARLYSSEEIEQLVIETTESGMLSEDAEEMISNIFDFGDREVGQVMTPRSKLEGIPVDIGYDALIKHVTESNHSRFPVYKDDLDHVIGILHLKDLIRHHRGSDEAFDLADLLRPTPHVPESYQVAELLKAFKLQRIHMAIVVDEYGGVAGIVTLEDLVEEVVGEVRDEFDEEKEPFVQIAPGEIEVAGDYLLDDLKEDIYLDEDKNLPDVDTVGGLIVTLLGGPPSLEDEIQLNDVTLNVTGIDGRAVTRARLKYPVPEVTNKHGHESKDSAEKSDDHH